MKQSLDVKLIEIKNFLMKNSSESHAVTVRIFNVNVKILTSFIRRDETKQSREEQNKMLKKHEEEAIDAYVKSLLIYSISSTRNIIYNAIASLKKAHDCDSSSKR